MNDERTEQEGSVQSSKMNRRERLHSDPLLMAIVRGEIPQAQSRRAEKRIRNLFHCLEVLSEAGLLNKDRILAGEPSPLPRVVLSELGSIGGKTLLIYLARQCICMQDKGYRTRDIATWVVGEHVRYMYSFVMWADKRFDPEEMPPALATFLKELEATEGTAADA